MVNNLLCELENEEYFEMVGGAVYTSPSVVGTRTGIYIANTVMYNLAVSYTNAYNDTVTSNGRSDLVKSYPERPTW